MGSCRSKYKVCKYRFINIDLIKEAIGKVKKEEACVEVKEMKL